MWLGLISVVMLLIFSVFLLGIFCYARTMQDERKKELAEIRLKKNEVRRTREQLIQNAKAPIGSRQERYDRSAAAHSAAANPELMRRHVAVGGSTGEAAPLLGTYSSPSPTAVASDRSQPSFLQ